MDGPTESCLPGWSVDVGGDADGLPYTPTSPPKQKHWDEERAAHPADPKLWRALFKAFFPMQVPMFLPFLVVTAAKIVQAHVGVKGLIEALDSNRPPEDVRSYMSAYRVNGWRSHVRLLWIDG